jgi:hypothetical protein
MNDLVGKEYRDFDGKRKWELLFEDMYLTVINTGLKNGRDINLLGISTKDLKVKWTLGGELESKNSYDGIVNIWIKNGEIWAGTWSGYSYRINYSTGEIVEKKFQK